MGDLDSALRLLASADVVAFAGVGLMSRVLPVTAAYRELSEAVDRDGAALRPHLDWLLVNGTAAGKVYGATLLDRLDPAAARAAWQRLAGARTGFTTFSGCIMNRTTLAEYAAGAAGRPA